MGNHLYTALGSHVGGAAYRKFLESSYMRILVKVISESGERDHVPRARALRVQFYSE